MPLSYIWISSVPTMSSSNIPDSKQVPFLLLLLGIETCLLLFFFGWKGCLFVVFCYVVILNLQFCLFAHLTPSYSPFLTNSFFGSSDTNPSISECAWWYCNLHVSIIFLWFCPCRILSSANMVLHLLCTTWLFCLRCNGHIRRCVGKVGHYVVLSLFDL